MTLMPESSKIQTLMTMGEVWSLYHEQIQAVESYTKRSLDSDTKLVNDIAGHLLLSGGKKIRPLLMILVSKLCSYSGSDNILLAGVIEFIHTATLLHDDVIDNAEIRRGKSAARFLWGNKASILVGDYLYSRAMCEAVSLDKKEVNEILAEACRRMTEGEVFQLTLNGHLNISESQYIKIVQYKTGVLLSAACRLGAILGEVPFSDRERVSAFGLNLGIAFQVADDTLDYIADGEKLGKSLGKDLQDGKITLPLIDLLKNCSNDQRGKVEEILRSKERISDGDLEFILLLMKDKGSIHYALERARARIEQAKEYLNTFPDSIHRQALFALADYVVTREY